MPSSHYLSISPVLGRIMALKNIPGTILDVGVGYGKWGFLFREMLDIQSLRYDKSEWRTTIHGVEVFDKYLREYHRYFYDRIFSGDIRGLEYDHYDLVFFGDILEHLDPEDGRRVIGYAKEHSGCVIVVTPDGFADQAECMGNPHEAHLCGYGEQELVALGFEVTRLRDEVGGYDMLMGVHDRGNDAGLLRSRNVRAWREAYRNGYASSMGDHRTQFYNPHIVQSGFYSDLVRASRIVEFGPGTGEFMWNFVRACPTRHFDLVDISDDNLGRLREKFAGFRNVSFTLNDRKELPLSDIDLGFSFLLCPSMPKTLWIEHLEEVYRVLRPGGSYVFQFTWNPGLGASDSVTAGVSGSQSYSPEAMAQLMEGAGFGGTISDPIDLSVIGSAAKWFIATARKE